ncbi:MAG: carboxymuconolactone decarboxylase family protein [Acidobacteria bacterium]|nr:carboxymuconolactone decarboxylase family protein [Acidobacteriota bacterium]
MTLDTLLETLPDYAKDLKLNYSSLVRNNTELTPTQLWGTVVASAIATRNATLTAAAVAEAAKHIDGTALDAAKAAAAIMGMNNIFYRFHHLSSNDKYAALPARLRMNVLRSHGSNPVDFELWSLAVSAINGCGKCVDSHERVVREKGITEETIAAVVRVCAVIHAIGPVLEERAAVSEPELVSA